MESPKPLVSVAIPVYNEREVLPELLERLVKVTAELSAYRWEFVFVDDGSKDDSLEVAKGLIAKEPRLQVVELRRNYGQTAALQAGLDETRGEIVLTMDADLQHFPEDIPKFLERIEAGSDVVCGWRQKRREGIIRRWPSRAANWMIRRISGLDIHDIGTTFRAYRREIVNDFSLLGENHRFVPVFARIAGAHIDEVVIENIERPTGQSNYGLGRVVNVWLDLFFLYFYVRYFDRPIRAFGGAALLLFLFAGGIAAVLGSMSVLYGTPVVYQRTGWIYLAVLLVMTATQFLMTGVIGEVLARIYFQRSRGAQHSPYKIRRRHDAAKAEAA
ncbi:MAG: glycosyltransferase family 2 protein [Labilithrix sp.]|nr:glycosyltransferase family 2 protein [Labilithrix sp.]